MSSRRTGKGKLHVLRRIAQSSVLVPVVCLGCFQSAASADTAAGVTINNVAAASFDQDGKPVSTSSNITSTQVAERLDVSITALAQNTAISRDTAVSGVPFRVINSGNGSEAFRLDAATDQPLAMVTGFALDTDNNGVYDSAIDTVSSDATTPALEAGTARIIFVLVANAAAAKADVIVSAGATAVTGSGAPGTVFDTRGDSGVDAVIGKTGAAAHAQAILTAAPGLPTLVKTQSVNAPDGSARAVRGATITYALTAHFDGRTPGAVVGDAIPQGTGYVAGSLTLDGNRLSDGADADAGSFDGSRVSVALGDIAAAGDRTITFKAIIQ